MPSSRKGTFLYLPDDAMSLANAIFFADSKVDSESDFWLFLLLLILFSFSFKRWRGTEKWAREYSR